MLSLEVEYVYMGSVGKAFNYVLTFRSFSGRRLRSVSGVSS